MKNKKFSKQFFLVRLLSSPFVLAVMTTYATYHLIRRFIMFLRYGGEMITFYENERPTINDIYKELKQIREDEGI